MPQVPLPQQGLQTGGASGFRAPLFRRPTGDPRSFQSARLGQAMLRGGLAISAAATDLRDRINVASIKEAQALFEETIVDADRAYLSRRGKDATGQGLAGAWAELNTQRDQIRGTLKPGVQQDWFGRVAARRLTDVRRRWGRHEDEQALAYELGTRKSLVEQKRNAWINAGPQDPQRQKEAQAEVEDEGFGAFSGLQDALRSGLGEQPSLDSKPIDYAQSLIREVQALGAALGRSPEEIEQMVLAETTIAHRALVENMVNSGRSTQARDYLARDSVKEQTDALSMDRLERLARDGSASEEGSRLAMSIWDELKTQFQEDVQTALPPPESLEESQARLNLTARADFLHADATAILQERVASGQIDFAVRDAALAELKLLAKLQSNENAIDAVQVRGEAEQWLTQNAPAGVDLLKVHKPVLYLRARSMGLLGELQDFAGGKDRRSDPAVWLRAELISDQDLNQLTPAELAREFAGGLTPQHMSEVAARWRKARGEATAEDESTLSKADRRTMTLVRNDNLWPATGRPSKRQVLDRFLIEEEIQREVNLAKGRGEPTDGEAYQKIVDGVVLDAATVPGWFTKRRPVVTIPEEDLPSAVREVGGREIPVIPSTDRKLIEEALNQAGIPITEAQVGRMFLENQRRRRQGILRNQR